jgi:hypothetical protein
MTRILKGNTSPEIKLVLAEGFDYASATVEVEYQGARRKFSPVKAGDILRFRLEAKETAPMALGAWPVNVRVLRGDGAVHSVPTGGVKIMVCDCPDEVHEGGFIAVDVRGSLFGVEKLPERYTDEDVRRKINEIISLQGGGAA